MIYRRLGVVIAAATLVAACGGTSATPTAPQTTPAPGVATTAPATVAPGGATTAPATVAPGGATTAPATVAPGGATTAPATAGGAPVTLTIESWRSDDKALWESKIIPAYEATHPNITLVFAPVLSTEYDNTLATRLQGGQAGDLITCRPFDVSQGLYSKGYLTSLNDLPGMENYTPTVKSAWSTDDGSTTFCVPMASVIHGFFYNKDVFTRLNLTPPKTNADFMSDLQAIKTDGKVAPLALGVKDQWPVALNGYYNIGPNFWKGEAGRYSIIMGTAKFTDPQFVAPFTQLTTWIPFLGNGYQAIGYSDAQTLFELGKAAINPAGSWDVPPFETALKTSLGWFAPPVQNAGDTCYQEDMIDHAMGMNAASQHPAEARQFLQWVASADFETLYANAIPGFFPVINQSIKLDDPLAQQILDTRTACQGSLRLSYQFLSRGTPNLENDLWTESAAVMTGSATPDAAAQLIQTHLASWYKPPSGFTPPSTAP